MGRRADGPGFLRLQPTRETMAVVPVPSEPARWFVVHRSVVVLGCTGCGAVRGEPCRKEPSERVFTRGRDQCRARECPRCRRTLPAHKATVCAVRRADWKAGGYSVKPASREQTRCSACRAVWSLDPATKECPRCGAPRTLGGHYAKGGQR